MLFATPDDLPPQQLFGILSWTITPRPIAWVTSQDENGRKNLAPFSFFTVVSTAPPMLAIAIEPRSDGTRKDTLANVLATREFVVHIAPTARRAEVAASSEETPPGFDEIDELSLTTTAAQTVKPPLLKGCIAAFECVLHDHLQPGTETVLIGRVLGVHVDRNVTTADGRIIPEQLDPLARVGTTFAEVDIFG